VRNAINYINLEQGSANFSIRVSHKLLHNSARAGHLTYCDCFGIHYILPNQQMFGKLLSILWFHYWQNVFAAWICLWFLEDTLLTTSMNWTCAVRRPSYPQTNVSISSVYSMEIASFRHSINWSTYSNVHVQPPMASKLRNTKQALHTS